MEEERIIMSGILLKEWFWKMRPKYKRLLFPMGDSFHIINLDEIKDNKYYTLKPRWADEIIVEQVVMVEEVDLDGDHWWER